MEAATQNIKVSLGASAAPSVDLPKMKENRAGWVSYGEKNDFPQQIMALTKASPVNDSINTSVVTYMCGKGFKNSPTNAEKYIGVPNPGSTWDDEFFKTATDFKIFNGFYLQIILNMKSTTVSVYHQDFTEVRIGKTDEAGNPLNFRISKDWKKASGKLAPITLDAWPGLDEAKPGQAYIYHYFSYTPGLSAYCIPEYFAALKYVRADGSLGEFYNNCIDNGFSPSAVISMPSNPEQAVKDEFQTDMERTFTGAKGACKVVTLWGEDEKTKPSITPFEMSHNADTYNNVEGIVFQKIISSHRLTSPTLAGVSGSGNLSGNAAEIIDAYVLFNYTVVESLRNRILNVYNMFTKINGTGMLAIDELDVIPKIRETETPEGKEDAAPATLRRESKLYTLFKKILWKYH